MQRNGTTHYETGLEPSSALQIRHHDFILNVFMIQFFVVYCLYILHYVYTFNFDLFLHSLVLLSGRLAARECN